jgi:hypothetical protein
MHGAGPSSCEPTGATAARHKSASTWQASCRCCDSGADDSTLAAKRRNALCRQAHGSWASVGSVLPAGLQPILRAGEVLAHCPPPPQRGVADVAEVAGARPAAHRIVVPLLQVLLPAHRAAAQPEDRVVRCQLQPQQQQAIQSLPQLQVAMQSSGS